MQVPDLDEQNCGERASLHTKDAWVFPVHRVIVLREQARSHRGVVSGSA